MSLPPEPLQSPPSSREHETLIQYNLRNKVCAYCKRPGALLKCEGCRQRSYCDRRCQKRDWKQEHRGQCVKLQQVFVPPPPGWRGAAPADGASASDGGGAAAAGGSAGIVDDDEIENPCPVCLDNEDDAIVDGAQYGMCLACGQSYCGACNAGGLATKSPNCPTCRAPFTVSEEEDYKRCWKLVHDRSPGRHTPAAQCNLGIMYANGKGVEKDHVEAAKWYRMAGMAAEAGDAIAQFNLGIFYYNGEGVDQDFYKALKWVQLAAAQGFEDALKFINDLQQANVIPTSPPGTAVTTILLTSANAAKYNNRTGRVVAPTDGAAIKPGRAAVLLDGEAAPISFKLKNLQIHP
eukprot:gene22491-biopygen729